MFRRRFRKKNGLSIPEVSLTPLIDTTLVLLVIFMVATPVLHNSLLVEIPEGKMKESPATPKEITIFIDKNNDLFLNAKKMSQKQLVEEISHMIKKTDNVPVVVKGDKLANYGTIIGVIDDVKFIGGVKHVTLATQRA